MYREPSVDKRDKPMLEIYAERTMPVESKRFAPDQEAIGRDRELVRRMLTGDERAFDEFADAYTQALFRFAITRLDGDRELTKEIVQTSLCKALAKIESYRGSAMLFTWLCSICRNEILMHFRSRKTAPAESPLDDSVTPIGSWVRRPTQPEEALLEAESATVVHVVLDLLPSHYADALEWKYLDRISVTEIGERLKVGTKAAESTLTRARAAFRKCYQRVVGEMCSAGWSDTAAPGGEE